MYQRVGKRATDVVVSGFALFVFAPVLVLLAVLVKHDVGSPIFFQQQRAGLGGRIFTIFKYRTMTNSFDHQGTALDDAQRLTSFGAKLRSTSLDEVPELWNILRGSMSLVGPRPLLVQYLPLYSTDQARRHLVRPGLTGLAQVQGRNALTWEEKFALDCWYVDHVSLKLDLWILWQTVVKVVRREGISAEGCVTMPPFEG